MVKFATKTSIFRLFGGSSPAYSLSASPAGPVCTAWSASSAGARGDFLASRVAELRPKSTLKVYRSCGVLVCEFPCPGGMSMIAFCPSCHRPAAIPPRAAGSGLRLACPQCEHQFTIDVPVEPIGEFRLVADDPARVVERPRERFPRRDPDPSDVPLFARSPGEGDGDPSGVAVNFYGSNAVRRLAARRRKPSPVSLLLQVVLGGAAALPLAVAILWYASSYDPLGWAPTVSRYVPWIVPADLQPAGNTFDSFSGGEDIRELPTVGSAGESAGVFTRSPTLDEPRSSTSAALAGATPDGVSGSGNAREVVEPEFAVGAANALDSAETPAPYGSADLPMEAESANGLPVVMEVSSPAGDLGLLETARSLASDPDEASAAAFYEALDSSLRGLSDSGTGSASAEGNELRAALNELRSVSALKPLLSLSDRRLEQLVQGGSVPYIDIAKVRGVKLPDAGSTDRMEANDDDASNVPASAVELVAAARKEPADGRLSIWAGEDPELVRSIAAGGESPSLLVGWLERSAEGDLVWRIVDAVKLR